MTKSLTPVLPPKIEIPDHVLSDCFREADSKFPLETGGIFLGVWSSLSTATVMEWVGPGPSAAHSSIDFVPDHEWQNARIASIYYEYAEAVEYLGDWHTHPNTYSAIPSKLDFKCVREIIDCPGSRCPTPVFGIFSGVASKWIPSFWIGRRSGSILPWKSIELNASSFEIV